MIPAYDRSYLEKAQVALGSMFDYAVWDLSLDLDRFAGLFVASGLSDRFGSGDIAVIAGNSGVEIVQRVISATGEEVELKPPRFTANRSKEYWTGWALAYYQWRSARRFRDILSAVPASRVRALYSPYHEMDLSQFAVRMDELMSRMDAESRLKVLRLAAGLTQRDLAERSGVPLRTIQHYEQGTKDFRRAAGETLKAFSLVLGVSVDRLV